MPLASPASSVPEKSSRDIQSASPIALLRFVANLSQTALADRCGVSRDTISRLERGERPRLDTARALAHALGVDVATLFPENEERPAGSPDALQMPAGQGRHASG